MSKTYTSCLVGSRRIFLPRAMAPKLKVLTVEQRRSIVAAVMAEAAEAGLTLQKSSGASGFRNVYKISFGTQRWSKPWRAQAKPLPEGEAAGRRTAMQKQQYQIIVGLLLHAGGSSACCRQVLGGDQVVEQPRGLPLQHQRLS